MARTPDRGEAKTAVLNIRVTPSLRAAMQNEADRSGRKLASECEERLIQSMEWTRRATSPESRQLLSEIEEAICELERGTGTRWHENVSTWAAVTDVLRRGPILQHPPKPILQRDEELSRLLAQIGEIQKEREHALTRLEFVGVEVPEVVGVVSFGRIAIAVREEINRTDLAPALKERAIKEVERLEELDEKQGNVAAAANRLMDDLADEVAEGREYHTPPPASRAVSYVLSRHDMRRAMDSMAAVVAGDKSHKMPPTAILAAASALMLDYDDEPAPAHSGA